MVATQFCASNVTNTTLSNCECLPGYTRSHTFVPLDNCAELYSSIIVVSAIELAILILLYATKISPLVVLLVSLGIMERSFVIADGRSSLAANILSLCGFVIQVHLTKSSTQFITITSIVGAVVLAGHLGAALVFMGIISLILNLRLGDVAVVIHIRSAVLIFMLAVMSVGNTYNTALIADTCWFISTVALIQFVNI